MPSLDDSIDVLDYFMAVLLSVIKRANVLIRSFSFFISTGHTLSIRNGSPRSLSISPGDMVDAPLLIPCAREMFGVPIDKQRHLPDIIGAQLFFP